MMLWFILGAFIGRYLIREVAYLVQDTLWVIRQKMLHDRRIGVINADGEYSWCACAACAVKTEFPHLIGVSSWGALKASRSTVTQVKEGYLRECPDDCDHPWW